jgi:hypothetical protein
MKVAEDVELLKQLAPYYGVISIRVGEQVTLVKQDSHPKSGDQVYQVKYQDRQYWVLEGDVAAQPDDWIRKLRSPNSLGR